MGLRFKCQWKSPKAKNWQDEQKQENREIFRFRVLVEHAICGAKRCRIVKDRLRCHKFGFEDLVMELACGLHNFKITLKEWCVMKLIYIKYSLILYISQISSVVSTINWRILLCAMIVWMNSISKLEKKRQGTNPSIGILLRLLFGFLKPNEYENAKYQNANWRIYIFVSLLI